MRHPTFQSACIRNLVLPMKQDSGIWMPNCIQALPPNCLFSLRRTACNTSAATPNSEASRLCIDQIQLGFNLASSTRPGPDRASQHNEQTLQQLAVDHLRKTLAVPLSSGCLAFRLSLLTGQFDFKSGLCITLYFPASTLNLGLGFPPWKASLPSAWMYCFACRKYFEVVQRCVWTQPTQNFSFYNFSSWCKGCLVLGSNAPQISHDTALVCWNLRVKDAKKNYTSTYFHHNFGNKRTVQHTLTASLLHEASNSHTSTSIRLFALSWTSCSTLLHIAPPIVSEISILFRSIEPRKRKKKHLWHAICYI